MRTQFEPADFKGAGQLVIRNSSRPGSTDHDFAITVSYKVGFLPAGGKILLVSLADGMANEFVSEAALCEHLNKDTFGYRPMTREEITNIVVRHGARFGT